MLCPACCDASPGPPSKGSSSPPRPSAAELSEGDIFAKTVGCYRFNRIDSGNDGGGKFFGEREPAKVICKGCACENVVCKLAGYHRYVQYHSRGKRDIVFRMRGEVKSGGKYSTT